MFTGLFLLGNFKCVACEYKRNNDFETEITHKNQSLWLMNLFLFTSDNHVRLYCNPKEPATLLMIPMCLKNILSLLQVSFLKGSVFLLLQLSCTLSRYGESLHHDRHRALLWNYLLCWHDSKSLFNFQRVVAVFAISFSTMYCPWFQEICVSYSKSDSLLSCITDLFNLFFSYLTLTCRQMTLVVQLLA